MHRSSWPQAYYLAHEAALLGLLALPHKDHLLSAAMQAVAASGQVEVRCPPTPACLPASLPRACLRPWLLSVLAPTTPTCWTTPTCTDRPLCAPTTPTCTARPLPPQLALSLRHLDPHPANGYRACIELHRHLKDWRGALRAFQDMQDDGACRCWSTR
jgi:hypothetical protein